VGRAEHHHLLAGADVAGGGLFAGVDRHVPTEIPQGVAYRFQMLAGHVEEVHRLGEHVLHPRVQLYRAPRAEIEQREGLLHRADEFADRLRVEDQRLGEPAVPTPAGVVDQAFGDGFGEIDLQRAVGEGELGVVDGGLHLGERKMGTAGLELAEDVEKHGLLAIGGGGLGGPALVLGIEAVEGGDAGIDLGLDLRDLLRERGGLVAGGGVELRVGRSAEELAGAFGVVVGRERPRLFQRVARGAVGRIESEVAEELLAAGAALGVEGLGLLGELADESAVGGGSVGYR